LARRENVVITSWLAPGLERLYVMQTQSFARVFAFRFTLTYLALYFPLLVLRPFQSAKAIIFAANAPWRLLVPWAGVHVFHLGHPFRELTDGLGDTDYDYVRLACVFVIALLAAAVWTILRRQPSHEKLAEWSHVALRYGLAGTLVSYGLVKLVKSQFPALSAYRLLEPFGQASPMGLLWAFMSYSPAYNALTGALEVTAGALLWWRRTTALGAFLAVIALANVVVLNFSYDVNVKLFSSHLLLMAVILAAPGARLLFDVLVLRRTVAPIPMVPHFTDQRFQRAEYVAKAVCIASVCLALGAYANVAYHTRGYGAPRAVLSGIYEVDAFTRDHAERPPLLTDTQRWRRVAITNDSLLVWRMNDHLDSFDLVDRADASAFAITEADDRATLLSYDRVGDSVAALRGTFEGAPIEVRLHKVDDASFRLLKRGFHWVNPRPYNY
jgi:hypothetical protein